MQGNSLQKAKRRFCEHILSGIGRPLGFIDVGSGGSLKHPWSLLPTSRIRKHNIDPEIEGGTRPVCISDRSGVALFRIAVDPRSSSLHEPSLHFIERFGAKPLQTERTIEVQLRTLSDVFGTLENAVDMMDVNVEGHDGQALRSADKLFQNNFIKIIKVEYELTEVWQGQGWFADIDSLMRSRGYELASMENELAKPANVIDLRAPGEPIWGKAIYVPSMGTWTSRAAKIPAQTLCDDCAAGIALYTIFDLPSRALDVARFAEERRALQPALSALPTAGTLYREFKSVFGVVRGRQLGRKLARYVPTGLRDRLRPLVLRLLRA